MKKFYCKSITILSLFILFGCNATKKYNEHNARKIPVNKLHQDVDFVAKKLFKLHPSIDWYIVKEDLQYKFDSLKNTINEPLTPNEFYFKLSPIVSEVRQGHTMLLPRVPKLEKKERKRLIKLGKNPVATLRYKKIGDSFYLEKNYSKDSLLLIGSKIETIEGQNFNQLFKQYKNTFSSDGFNETFLSYGFSSRFPMYFALNQNKNDSIAMVFSFKDSLFEKVMTRKALVIKDSIKQEPKPVPVILTKEQKKEKALERKQRALKNRLFLYDFETKEYVRSLTYANQDSTTAILKIKGFKHSKHKKAYDSIFKEIETNKVENLILDLRNNPGGSLNEIHYLYGYLTNEPYQFIDTIKVTSKTGVATNRLRNAPIVPMVIASPFVLYTMISRTVATKKDKNGTYIYVDKTTKTTMPKPNAFQGKVYVLINGGSFSASCILSSNLKGSKRAIFVGEETGGTFNGTIAGNMPNVSLPNSKLTARIGMQDIRPKQKTTDFGRGIFPDIAIETTVEDLINNTDSQLNWILEDIEKNKKQIN